MAIDALFIQHLFSTRLRGWRSILHMMKHVGLGRLVGYYNNPHGVLKQYMYSLIRIMLFSPPKCHLRDMAIFSINRGSKILKFKFLSLSLIFSLLDSFSLILAFRLSSSQMLPFEEACSSLPLIQAIFLSFSSAYLTDSPTSLGLVSTIFLSSLI